MRVHSAVLAGVLCLLVAAGASAQISRISPSSFTPSGEDFITIFGEGLLGGVATEVVFDGLYTVEPQGGSASRLEVWVPVEVLLVEGQHCLSVRAIDAAGVRVLGPVCFTVELPDGGGSGPPVLSLPEFVGAEATSPNGAVVTYEASAFDANGSVALTCSRESGSTFPLGTTNVLCSATNAEGTSSGQFLVVVGDTTPPVVTVPADIETDKPVVTFTASAVDNIDGSVPVICSPASGSTFPSGNTTVVCVATDARANSGFGFFRVRITGGAPTLTVPDNIVEEATSPAGAVVTFMVTSDDGSPVTCNPPSGFTFALGTTTVNCSATNASGTGTASFLVTILDTTPPLISAPALVEAEATSPAGAIVTYAVTAFDLVDGSVPVNCAPPSGSQLPLGTTDVVCTASDTRGNTDSIAFQVIVADTTAPEVTRIVADPALLWPPNHKMVNVTVSATLVDAVDPAPTWKILSVASNQPINGTGDGDAAPDWIITGPTTVQLRAERAGSSERVYTITIQTMDSAGNVGTAKVFVRVSDGKKRAARH